MTRPVAVGVAVVALVALGFGLYWFQPWKLAGQIDERALP